MRGDTVTVPTGAVHLGVPGLHGGSGGLQVAARTLPAMDALRCERHPDTETYLRCSQCSTPICPDCWVDAAVGYHCPACAAERDEAVPQPTRRAGGGRAAASPAPGQRLPLATGARAAGTGFAAALLGGALLGPVLAQGFFFLITAGAIGWGVARAVYWGTAEVSTPFVRAIALTTAGFTVPVGLATAQGMNLASPSEIALLAFPAAVYGGWIVVRQR
ncbi:hypothetical protein FTX61_07730 [Nitriliruptoraceae bacterium ZYF776]|nr:hypothetical protein [Profundirhabdus halotolerans]